MKIIISLFVFLFSLSINAQWEIVNEGGNGYINDIDFFNDHIGWIECEFAVLLTTDAGDTWNYVYKAHFIEYHISDAVFVTDKIGWVIYNNSLFKTMNGGESWNEQYKGEIRKLHALNQNVLFLSGAELIKSVNGGIDWSSIETLDSNNSVKYVNDCYFINLNYGFICQPGLGTDGVAPKSLIYKTIDGGNSWGNPSIISDASSARNLYFINDSTGFVLFYSTSSGSRNTQGAELYSTIDSGRTWQKLINNVTSYTSQGSDEIYVTLKEEEKSSILLSTDQGKTWNEKYQKNLFFHDICQIKNKSIFLVEGVTTGWRSEGMNFGLHVLKNDYDFNEDTWKTSMLSEPLNSIHLINDHKWMMGGNDGVFHWGYTNLIYTKNGGSDYEIISNRNGQYASEYNYSFINEEVGYFVDTVINKTEDGGENWYPIPNQVYFSKLFFHSKNVGWGKGYIDDIEGIYKTENGGIDWEIDWRGNEEINSIYFFDENHGWAVGERYDDHTKSDGIFLKYDSTNGWTDPIVLSNYPLRKIYFISENTGLLLGGYSNEESSLCKLLRSFDGGNTWDEINDLGYYINDFALSSDGTIWAVGESSENGVILKSNDFGETWEIESDTFSYPLNAISVKDSLVVAVGDNGIIIKTKNRGITWVDHHGDIVASKFNLSQNYPNPFNPVTTIKYSIPIETRNEIGDVRLKIYDILGREVAILVNEKQKPGNYEIEWDAVNYSSGIFFYRISAGEYIETKKMVLLK